MPPLDPTRQSTIDALCEHFANDVMSMDEFERRVDRAHQASSAEELKALLQDLPGPGMPATTGSTDVPTLGRGVSVDTPHGVRERSFAIAVLGGTRRGGPWTPARTNVAIAVLGGAEIDFREAAMSPGVTELRVFALLGGVEVIVPPGMNVVSHGIGLLGGFDHAADGIRDPSAPTLSVRGMALMGGVDITVRHVGESARDARRRRRQERRDQARAIRERSAEDRRRLKP